jgi:hypothetical protein
VVLASLVCLLVMPFVVASSSAWVPIALGAAGIWGAIVALSAVGRGSGERSLEPGKVEVRPGSVVVQALGGSRRTVSRADVVTGWCEPVQDRVTAVLQLRRGDLVLVEQPDERAARAVLSHAGIEETAQAIRMRLGGDNVAGRAIRAFLLAPLAMIGIPAMLAPFALVIALPFTSLALPLASVFGIIVSSILFGGLLWWLGSKLIPSWLSIGSDGILVHKGVRKTFLPYSRVTSAMIGGGQAYFHVTIVLSGGEIMTVPAASRDQADAVVRQIDAAIQAFETRGRADLVDGLGRNGRPANAWRAALKAVMTEGAYRQMPVGAEQLLRIAEDPGVPEDVRVGAVLALKSPGDEAAGKRIRVAAEACASPRVRVALRRAADGVIADAELAELEAEDPAIARKL